MLHGIIRQDDFHWTICGICGNTLGKMCWMFLTLFCVLFCKIILLISLQIHPIFYIHSTNVSKWNQCSAVMCTVWDLKTAILCREPTVEYLHAFMACICTFITNSMQIVRSGTLHHTYIYNDWEFPHSTQYVVPYTYREKSRGERSDEG